MGHRYVLLGVLVGAVAASSAKPTITGVVSGAATQPQGLSIVSGTAANPDLADYGKPLVYVERWASGDPTGGDRAVWGYEKMAPTVLIENRVVSGGVAPALAVRTRSDTYSAGVGDGFASAYILAETFSPGQNRRIWALNPIVSWQAGASPRTMVAIEADVLNAVADSSNARPTAGGPDNFTAYWAQAGANKMATAGFMTSSSVPGFAGSGFWYGHLAEANFGEYIAYYRNTLAPDFSKSPPRPANGVAIVTMGQGATNKLLETYSWNPAPINHFTVDADRQNSVSILVGGAVKRLEVGEADSGGQGYRILRVVN